MENYKGFIILNPYSNESNEFFKKYPNGEDMKLKLMCAGPEGSFYFFPENYDMNISEFIFVGHPLAEYSTSFASLDKAKIAIDNWLPQYEKIKARCGAGITVW